MVINKANSKKAFKFFFSDEVTAKSFLDKITSLDQVAYAQHPRPYYDNPTSKTEVLVTGVTGSILHDVALLAALKKEAESLGGILVPPTS